MPGAVLSVRGAERQGNNKKTAALLLLPVLPNCLCSPMQSFSSVLVQTLITSVLICLFVCFCFETYYVMLVCNVKDTG